MDDIMVDKAVRLRQDGLSYAKIGMIIGVSAQTVRRAISVAAIGHAADNGIVVDVVTKAVGVRRERG
jgi:orotate phosphoribosyltransferase-like protein